MVRPTFVIAAIILLWAMTGASCAPSESQKVLTVAEVEPRIDALDGQTLSVAGYLSDCAGNSCILYQTKKDADEWDRVMAAVHMNQRVMKIPETPSIGIGNGSNRDFDAKAAPFTHSYVVITGTVTNECRIDGKPACTDRGPDLKPTAIRAGSAPAG